MTKVRQALVEILFHAKRPLTATDMADFLKKSGLKPDKTTIYRELEFLRLQKLVSEVRLAEGRLFYEWQRPHHHHVVCRRCERVSEVELTDLEDVFAQVESSLRQQTGFTAIDHALEFLGLCARCVS